jgi:hypothetical protein
VLEVLLKVQSKSVPTMLLQIFAVDIMSLTVLILSLVSHSMCNLSQNAVLYPHPENEDDLRSIRMSEL